MSTIPSEWLRGACELVEKGVGRLSSEPRDELNLGNANVCPEVAAYIQFVWTTNIACSIGHFEFWSWQRLTSKDDSAELYGGQPMDLVIADWMLDSAFCAVNVNSGRMIFLGGEHPVITAIPLKTFLRQVLDNPLVPHGMT